jgi:hypothetical protein
MRRRASTHLRIAITHRYRAIMRRASTHHASMRLRIASMRRYRASMHRASMRPARAIKPCRHAIEPRRRAFEPRRAAKGPLRPVPIAMETTRSPRIAVADDVTELRATT